MAGHYRLTADVSGSGHTTITGPFTGTLEADIDPNTKMPYRITNLDAPLFATLTGTVKNLVLEDVSISGYDGNTGAIACTANGAARINNVGILSGSVGGTEYTGSLVGLLDGTARVINCYSYANITGGNVRAGIVGYNNYASKYSALKTMVMNCMFYGNITGGTISPIYGGKDISNDNSNRLNNYNYFLYEAPFSKNNTSTNVLISQYNHALAAEERFLNRFEFYRLLLNSNRELAAWYMDGSVANARTRMAKWVLDKSIAPYPILKVQGKYPSIINYDPTTTPVTPEEIKELTVNISGTGITTNQVKIPITDKDPNNFNFNYHKVQLPYFNDVGTGNYTGNQVVTGWEVTVTGGTTNFTTTDYDAPNYNFADRQCTGKDNYATSGRIFSQGAYFDVPEGVSSISITPHWATCVYLSDTYYDSYGYNSNTGVSTFPQRYSDSKFNGQDVYTTFSNALTALNTAGRTSTSSVYDYAVVLVGNYHQKGTPRIDNNDKNAFTVMSADLDGDNEPDYSLIINSGKQEKLPQIRFDFLNVPGTAMAHKQPNSTAMGILGNMNFAGWFEVTNTCVIRFSQFEYDGSFKTKLTPLILQGGVVEQFVCNNTTNDSRTYTQYIHVGGNVWFKMLSNGNHMDKSCAVLHRPISVSGGDYESFYLSGYFNPQTINNTDNAECYIDGGRFGEVAGAGQEQIKGNVTWKIDHADIEQFFGGGINDNKPITGNVNVSIKNSHVNLYCGGPKFGNMQPNMSVVTNANNCTFGTFFGAGYGGTALERTIWNYKPSENQGHNQFQQPSYPWNTWLTDGHGYVPGQRNPDDPDSKGLAVNFEYDFFEGSADNRTVGRLYVNYATMSTAQTNDVTSTLTGCHVTHNFYGGGSLGKVTGTATSTLTGCTIDGNVFGAGFSAEIPTVDIYTTNQFDPEPNYNTSTGVFEKGGFPDKETYTWTNDETLFDESYLSTTGGNWIYTEEDLSNLGQVQTANLTITGTTTVLGSVYGGGEESAVGGNTEVTIEGGTISENVYGGGNLGSVGTYTVDGNNYTFTEDTGECTVNITGGTVGAGTSSDESGNVFGAGKGVANTFQCEKAMVYQANVNISGGTVKGTVYGGGEIGRVEDDTEVKIGEGNGGAETPTPNIHGNIFGAGKGLNTHGYSALVRGNSKVTVEGDAKVDGSIYGGGEISSVGRYTLVNEENKENYPGLEIGMPGSLANNGSGKCTVIVQGHAEIGPNGMQMTATGGPDDVGHVFGAGEGATPQVYTYADKEHMPKRMMSYNSNLYKDVYGPNEEPIIWEYADDEHQNVWEYFDTEAKYLTFIETMALTTQTEVTVDGSAFVKGSVYGGSENGFVQHDTKVMIKGGQIGAGDGKSSPYDNDKFINPATTPVTSSNALTACAHWTYTDDGAPYDKFAGSAGYDSKGGATTATDGHTFYGNVFGGGSGYYPYAPGKWHRKAGSVGGDTRIEISGGHILSNVYGGNEQTDVGTYTHDENDAPYIADGGTCTIVMTGGTIGVPRIASTIEALPTIGHLYGAGKGDKRILFNTWTNVGATNVSVSGGIVYGNVYGGGEDGHVMGNAVTTISETDATNKPTVIGSVGNAGLDGNVFGGGQGSPTALTAGVVGGNVNLSVQGGHMLGSVYGGGRIASVGTFFAMATDPRYGKMQDGDNHGCLTVNLTGGTIEQNVYGGCMGTNAAANADEEAIAFAAKLGMSKTVAVNLNQGVADNAKGCAVIGDIFGCNNTNASPQQDVTVHIYATQNAEKTQIANTNGETPVTDAKVKGVYDVHAVYGGGNLAAYKPITLPAPAVDDDGKDTKFSTNVIIDGCDKTSIRTVYGGGNAASTPATSLTVNGTYEIEEVFGGGNGKDQITIDDVTMDNPGANVGFYDYSKVEADFPTKEDRQENEFTSKYIYGSGKASVNIFGGTVHRVFGGSNTKGNVRQTAVTMLDENSGCDFCVDEAYGGGKEAPMDAEAKLHMACIPGLSAAYGGAEAADIQGNVTLNITNGTFDRVFGGNNKSGTISGSLTVNIEEVGCKPIIIGELYGGGNLAGYSVYGYDNDDKPIESGTTPLYNDPQVNVKSFTSIGDIYGGGYGESAVMVGNPTANVSVAEGDWKDYVGDSNRYEEEGYMYNATGYKGETLTITDDNGTHDVVVPSHAKGKIGAINNVFGGGNAAKVIGNTNVNIGTLSKVTVRSYVEKAVDVGASVEGLYTRTGEGTVADPYKYIEKGPSDVAEEGVTYYEEKEVDKDVLGADIRGNVYGGGNNAEVTGSTNVQIGKKNE